MAQIFLNNAKATIQTAVTVSDTVIGLENTDNLPTSLEAGDWFLLTLFKFTSRTGSHIEVVKVTAWDGFNATVVRGQEGSTPKDYEPNDQAEARLTAESLNMLRAGIKDAVPSGIISMWAGALADIPGGWALCDGDNGTPNLADRFVVGAGGAYAKGATGGSADAVVVAHSHTGSTSTEGNHRHSIPFRQALPGNGTGSTGAGGYVNSGDTVTGYSGNHGHGLSIDSAGESGTNKNLPPYYALAYIMKL